MYTKRLEIYVIEKTVIKEIILIQWNPAKTDLKGLAVFFRLCRIPVLPIWLFLIVIKQRKTEELMQEDRAHLFTKRLDMRLPPGHLGRSGQPTDGWTDGRSRLYEKQ